MHDDEVWNSHSKRHFNWPQSRSGLQTCQLLLQINIGWSENKGIYV